GLFDDRHKPVVDGTLLEDSQFFNDGPIGAPVFQRHRVEDFAATDGDHRRVLPDDEAIIRKRESRLLEPDLRKCGFSGLQTFLSKENRIAHQLRRSDVESNPLARFYSIRRRQEQFEMAVEHGRRLEHTRNGEHHVALDIGHFHAQEVECCTLSGARYTGSAVMNLDASNPSGSLLRKNFDLFFLMDLPGYEGTGNECS